MKGKPGAWHAQRLTLLQLGAGTLGSLFHGAPRGPWGCCGDLTDHARVGEPGSESLDGELLGWTQECLLRAAASRRKAAVKWLSGGSRRGPAAPLCARRGRLHIVGVHRGLPRWSQMGRGGRGAAWFPARPEMDSRTPVLASQEPAVRASLVSPFNPASHPPPVLRGRVKATPPTEDCVRD